MERAEREQLKAEIKRELVETLAPVVIRAIDRAVDVRLRAESPPLPSNIYRFPPITQTQLRAVPLQDPVQFLALHPRRVKRQEPPSVPEEERPEDVFWKEDQAQGQ